MVAGTARELNSAAVKLIISTLETQNVLVLPIIYKMCLLIGKIMSRKSLGSKSL